jgi:hypothetical protein
MMRFFLLFSLAVGLVACSQLVTPFSAAKIIPQTGESGTVAGSSGTIHRYRIGGLQQMVIFLDPQRGSFLNRNPRDSFTQEELSKLRIKVTSLSGKLSVNGRRIGGEETVTIDLGKAFNSQGREGVVRNFGKLAPTIRFVSYNNLPADQNLCDFILTIEDPQGITRSTGLKVHGGFTDSL